MRIEYSPKFKESFLRFPAETRKRFYKQAGYLLKNFHHSSLHTKKYDERRGIWQARVDRKTRFYFLIRKDTYILLDIKKHPK